MTILQVDSSISGENSISRRLTRDIVGQLGGWGQIIHRDLVAEPLAHLTERGQDEAVLEEFLAADIVVVGAPMYNFTVPSQLKAWIDRLAVAGRTFRYGENGPEGLLGGKRVIIALAYGGNYDEGHPFEHLKSYLNAFFAFLGITPEYVTATGVALGVDKALERADAEIQALAA